MSKCEPTRALRADAIYVAPSGRPCRWVPAQGERISSYSTFVYLDTPAQLRRHVEAAAWHDAFVLSPANYQLLREVPCAAAR